MQNVLIVEDDLEQLKILSDLLSTNYPAWTVSTASTYNQATQLIDESVEKHTTFSLFLFDVQLSAAPADKMGFELGKHLRTYEEYFSTPVLFLTAVPDENFYALHNVHYYDYITKPYAPTDILNRLTQMLMRNILPKDTFFVTDVDAISHRIVPSDIYYVHSVAHILFIKLKNYTIKTRCMNMSTIEPYITPQLIKCHSRYYVNREYIDNFDPVNRLVSIDSESITVSKRYLPIITELLKKG